MTEEKKMDEEKTDALQAFVGSDVPDFLREGPANVEGTEDIGAEDLKMPRLAIAQGTSKQINKAKPEYIEGLELGQLFNTLEKTVYGEGPFKFWIARRNRPRHMEFRSFEEGGGVLDFDVPANDPRTKFGEDGAPPVATKFYDYIIILEHGEMIALSCKSTSLKAAMQLNGLIKNSRQALYARNYSLRAVPDSNDKGDYFVFSFETAGWVSSLEELEQRKAVFDGLKDRKIDIDIEGVQEEDANTAPSTEESEF